MDIPALGVFIERLLRRPGAMAWMNRASGTILVMLGLRLAAAERP
jgi:threonine/homoserine/homoserine lactone efflux protein